MLLPAVRALEIAVVLYQAQDGHIQQPGHFDRLGDNHGHQILRGGNHHNAIHRQRLKNGEGYVSGSRRHIHEEVVQIAPYHIGPKLLHDPSDDGPPPDHRVGLMLCKEVEAHNLHPALGVSGIDTKLRALCLGVNTECLGDRGSSDVGVQNTDPLAHILHRAGQRCGYQALAHAPLAAHNSDDLFNGGQFIQRGPQILGLRALPAAFSAGGALMGAV